MNEVLPQYQPKPEFQVNPIVAPGPIPPDSQPSRYVSIFEDPERFVRQMEIATAFSKTQFVPTAFRGKPEDCLVALDLACRFELQPLAVFPEIYVIDNKASFSSKFLIALVNRSGRFSRIQWEEGTDGEIEAVCSEWKKNGERGQRDEWKQKFTNFYAKAFFTELKTGERYESPVVDMRFADANGWILKPGSKWRTMPQIMCRYRSASILIKSVCPEIIAGLDFAEEAADIAEDRPPIVMTVRSEPPKPAPRIERSSFPSDLALAFNKQIRESATVEQLRAVAAEIGSANLIDREVQELRQKYAERLHELEDKEKEDREKAEREAAAASKAPAAPEKKPVRKSRKESEAYAELRENAANAKTAEALAAIHNAAETCMLKGLMTFAELTALNAQIESRLIDLETEAAE